MSFGNGGISRPSDDKSGSLPPNGYGQTRTCMKCGREDAFFSCLECEGASCEECVDTHPKLCGGLSNGIKKEVHVGLTKDKGVEKMSRMNGDSSSECPQHIGQSLDKFCTQHEESACSTSTDQHHRSSKGVSSVSKMAEKVTKSKEYKTFKSDLHSIRDKLSKLKKDRRDDQKKLKQETDDSLSAISEFRKDINWVLDRLEKKGKGFVEKRYKELTKSIEEDIKACDDMIKDLDKWIDKMEAKTVKTDVFYNVEKGKNTVTLAENVCKEIKSERNQNDIVKFSVDPKVKEFAMGLSWYGKDRTLLSFEPPVSLPHMYTVKNNSNFDMRSKGDKAICSITSGCQFPDGTFIITDAANKKIKHVDITYKVADAITVEGEPLASTVMSDTTAAVSVSDGSKHSVNIVGIEQHKLTKIESFDIDKFCKGLAATCDILILAFEDSLVEYTTEGCPVREIFKGASFNITSFVSNNICSRLYLADRNGKILSLDTEGTIISEMKDTLTKDPRCLALDRTDQLFVAGYESHSVCMFSHEGEELGTLLTGKSQGFKQPQMVCFDRFNSRLLMAVRGSNCVKVFDLK